MVLQFHSFLQKHWDALWITAVLWVAVNLLWRAWRHGIVFPPVKSVAPRFHENTASGRSLKNWITRLGGASNCLRVTVTDSEVWIRLYFPFNLFASSFDLAHRIPRSRILAVVPYPPVLRSGIQLEFRLPDGNPRILHLRLRRLAALAVPPPLPEHIFPDGKPAASG